MAILRVRIEPESHADAMDEYLGRKAGKITEPNNSRILLRSLHGRRFCTPSQELLQNVDIQSSRDFQWYFEDYAVHDPFSKTRAEIIRTKIRDHGRRLLREFLIPEICPSTAAEDDVLVEIHDAKHAGTTSLLEVFYWEILEDRTLWEEVYHFQPKGVHVVRVHRAANLQKSDKHLVERPSRSLSELKAVKRILAVTARPSHTKDIPHRLITRSIADAVGSIGHDKVSLEIVRPGTFAALKRHLESRPIGYFQVLHLDLHGIADENGARLMFVKFDSSMRCRPDEKSATELAELLAEHGIETVVINACRSSAGHMETSNVSSLLVHAGVKTAIGMAFNILSSAAGNFMEEFYKCFLSQNIPAIRAVSYARSILRLKPIRKTKFHTDILLEDHLVPIVHCSEDEVSNPNLLQLDATLTELRENRREYRHTVLGREGDILRLESHLTHSEKINIHIAGPPGVGKTTLLKYAGMWWKETGLYRRVVHLNLDSACYKDTNIQGLKDVIRKSISNCADNQSSDDTMQKLNSGAYLLILDSLESSQWHPRNGKPENAAQLRVFLRALKGCSVIVSSRLNDSWLGSSIQYWCRMDGLDTINAVTLVQSILKEQDKSHNIPQTPENLQDIEHLTNLVQGNPLAIRLVIDDMIHRLSDTGFSMQSYLTSLLQLQPVFLDVKKLHDEPGARSVTELLSFFSAGETVLDSGRDVSSSKVADKKRVTAASLMAFWRRLPSNFEPFSSCLEALSYARSYLKEAGFINFRRRLRLLIEEYAPKGIPIFEILTQECESIGYHPNLAKVYSEAAQKTNSILEDLLVNELLDYVEPAQAERFGIGGKEDCYDISYHAVSPILTLVSLSSVIRESCAENFTTDVEVSRAALYEFQQVVWLRSGLLLSSPGGAARVMVFRFDFFNLVSLCLSLQKIDSWPLPQDWNAQYLIADVALKDHELLRFVIHVLQQFIVLGMTHLRILRQKHYLIAENRYSTKSQIDHRADWRIATELECALTSAILRALACCDLSLKPKESFVQYWEFLVTDPMFLSATDMDPDVRKLLLASHSTNSKLLALEASHGAYNISAVEEVTDAGTHLIKLQRDLLEVPSPTETLNGSTADDSFETLQRFRQNFLTVYGLDSSPMGMLFAVMKSITSKSTVDEIKSAVSQVEKLLQDEVEDFNLPHNRYNLHRCLVEFHRRLGNAALAAQHLASQREVESMLDPPALAYLERVNFSWSAYARQKYITTMKPQTKDEILESMLAENRNKLQMLRGQKSEDDLDTLSCLFKVALTLSDLGRYSEAVEHYRNVIRGRQRLLSLNDREVLRPMFVLAKSLLRLGQYDEAIRLLRILRNQYATSDEDRKLYQNVVGVLGLAVYNRVRDTTSYTEKEKKSQLDEAVSYLEESAGLKEVEPQAPDENHAIALNNLAQLYAYRGDFPKAEARYKESIEMRLSITGDIANDGILGVQNGLAGLLSDMKKDDEAVQLYKRILDQRIETYGVRHEGTLLVLGNLHYQYRHLKMFDEAQKLIDGYSAQYERSIEASIEKIGRGHFDLERANLALATKLYHCKCYTKAGDMFEKIITAWINDNEKQKDCVQVLAKLASCHESCKPEMWDEALKIRMMEIDLLTKLFGATHQDTLIAIEWRVVCMRNLGQLTQAVEVQKELIRTRTRISGPNDFRMVSNTIYLGHLYLDQEDWATAAAQYRIGYEKRQSIDPNTMNIIDPLSHLAFCHMKLEQWDKALDYRKEQMRIQCHNNGPESKLGLDSTLEVAWATHQFGQHNEARALLTSVIEIRQRSLELGHFDTLSAMITMAVMFRREGKLSKSEEILKQVFTLRSQQQQQEGEEFKDSNQIRMLAVLGFVYRDQGLHERAAELIAQAIEARRKWDEVGPAPMLEEDLLSDLATEYVTLERWDDAAQTLEESLTALRSLKTTTSKTARVTDRLNRLSVVNLKRGLSTRRRSYGR